MKPSWKDAPKWAKFLAQEEAGDWWWYEVHPYWNETGGSWSPCPYSHCQRADEFSTYGNGTLERKP